MLFISKRGLNSEILHIWKVYLTLEIVKQDMTKIQWVQHITVFNTLLSLAIYCVHSCF